MDLRKFIEILEHKGTLARIRKTVDTRYELSAVVRKLNGRPVFFENVKGHKMPVVSNVCSTRELVCLGLKVEKEELVQRLTQAIEAPKDPEIFEPEGYDEIAPDLSSLPILTYYPKDGGPYIASGIVFARDREYGINASYHRAMVIARDRMVLRILERHLYKFMERGLREFAFCIGNSMPILVAAAISADLGKSELAIANALGPIKAVNLEGHVIPESEIVMICEFTGEQAEEGPFLDLTGTFDIVRKQSVARVKNIFVKKEAIFHALLPGDMEHKVLMGMPREPTIFREVSRVCQCLKVYITPGGCSWLHAVIKIRKEHDDDGKKAIEAAFQGHASLKHVFVVDEDIDIEDPQEIEWALATRFQGNKGLIVKPYQKGSSLDPSADSVTRETTKVGFDLTIPIGARKEKFERAQPPIHINLENYL